MSAPTQQEVKELRIMLWCYRAAVLILIAQLFFVLHHKLPKPVEQPKRSPQVEDDAGDNPSPNDDVDHSPPLPQWVDQI